MMRTTVQNNKEKVTIMIIKAAAQPLVVQGEGVFAAVVVAALPLLFLAIITLAE